MPKINLLEIMFIWKLIDNTKQNRNLGIFYERSIKHLHKAAKKVKSVIIK